MQGNVSAVSTSLDVPTLLVVATSITALLGLVLLFVWVRDRSVRALAWWGTAYLIGGSAIALWSQQWSSVPLAPADMPSALLFLTCGLAWNGARLFQGRALRPLAMSAGALVWLFLCRDPDFAHDGVQRVILSSLVISAYTFLTAFEFWRERRRSLFTHWSAVLVPALHGAMFLAPALLAAFAPGVLRASLSANGWFALFALETLLYAVGTAFIILMMTHERAALVHKTAALTDPLTGLFNRRAFFEGAERLIQQQAGKRGEVALLMFDLDRFKSINDRFGHRIGDEALRVFASSASTALRASDVLARLGGEEFAVMIGCGVGDACSAAERLRAAFEAAGSEFAGHSVGATVSIGVAAAPAATADVEDLLARADRALYQAKTRGRNRVEAAAGEPAVTGAAPTRIPVRQNGRAASLPAARHGARGLRAVEPLPAA